MTLLGPPILVPLTRPDDQLKLAPLSRPGSSLSRFEGPPEADVPPLAYLPCSLFPPRTLPTASPGPVPARDFISARKSLAKFPLLPQELCDLTLRPTPDTPSPVPDPAPDASSLPYSDLRPGLGPSTNLSLPPRSWARVYPRPTDTPDPPPEVARLAVLRPRGGGLETVGGPVQTPGLFPGGGRGMWGTPRGLGVSTTSGRIPCPRGGGGRRPSRGRGRGQDLFFDCQMPPPIRLRRHPSGSPPHQCRLSVIGGFVLELN